MNQALQELARLDLAHRRAKHPNLPAHALVPSTFSDKTANDLTQCIIRWLRLNGYFATRLQSTGTYREDLKRYVPSQQVAGMPDVLACVYGRFVGVEVKVGRDRLSEDQKATFEALRIADALLYVASDFQGFYDWFTQRYAPKRIPLIPRLATPDLPNIPHREPQPTAQPSLFPDRYNGR